MTPAAFLQMIENISGLLLEREQGTYYFAHLTFQEYLASTFIRDQGQEAVLLAHLGESWWEETTRLYSAQTDATKVIAACLNHPTLSIPHLMLAFECREEALLVQPTIKPQLDSILEYGVEDADPQRRKVVAETLLKRRLKEMVSVQEGIYRDTSLILCAEYQLFLDEQHVQGRYYQPDHWTSFQFSPGQALLPIVGVRPSAAQAFCAWLTEREQGIWQYRLPRSGEYQPEKVLIQPEWLPSCAWNNPHGYWQAQKSTFVWIRQSVPEVLQETTTLREPFVSDTSLDLDLSSMNISPIVQVKITERDRFISYLDGTFALALALAHNSDLVRVARASALTRAISNASALARAVSGASDLALTLASASDLALTLVSASNLASASDLARTSNLANASTLARFTRVRTQIRDLASTRASILASDFTHASDLARVGASALAHASDFFYASDFASALIRALALIRASIRIFDLERIEIVLSSPDLDLALLLNLLSICVSFNAYDLFTLETNSNHQLFWKRIFTFRRRKKTFSSEIQEFLNRGIEIHQRLERLKKRRLGEELACEGILIIKERKQDL